MNQRKKIWWSALLGLTGIMAVSANGAKMNNGKGEIKIGVSLMTYEHSFMQDMLASVRKACAERGVKLVDVDGNNDVSKQLSGIEDMLNSQGIDGLLLNPVDTDAIVPAVFEANDDRVPVVTMDVRAAKGDVYAHVASDNLKIGKMAGEYAVQLLEARNGSPSGNIVIFGFSKITSMRDRVQGFIDIISKYPKITYKIKEPVVLSVEDCVRLAEDTFTVYGPGNVDLFYGSNATTLNGLVAAQESAARMDFQMIGVDDDPVFIAALQKESSTLAAFIAQTPTEIGDKAVQLVLDAINGVPAKNKDIATTVTLVTRDTVKNYISVSEERERILKPYK